MLVFMEGSNLNASLPFHLVTRDESRFSQLAEKVFDVHVVVRHHFDLNFAWPVLEPSFAIRLGEESGE